MLLVILTRSGLAGGAVFFASLFSLIMDSERELLAAKAELRELEAHDLYGTWQARRFDDDLGEGLRNFGATLHSAKESTPRPPPPERLLLKQEFKSF